MTKRILLVDDEPEFTRIVRLVLESQGGYEVREVNDSRICVREARAFRPDLVVLDIMMPHFSGTEVATQLRAESAFCRTPLIYLTALGGTAEMSGFNLDQRAYLRKPVSWDDLIERIERETTPRQAPTPIVPELSDETPSAIALDEGPLLSDDDILTILLAPQDPSIDEDPPGDED